ncbi:DotU family type IV/VI secretion system protein [Buttiauxella gaviniae]|uniref:DotU family type IV/VI secretion system protein n=1 Tax=Buttiauxella gaviniae TaxID=82990 RepID=UPI003975FCB7
MRLLDCYSPVFYLACDVAQGTTPFEDYAGFRQQVKEVFNQSLAASQALLIPAKDIDDALFAVTVWFDEVVLRSDFPFRNFWRADLLQMEYFDTVIGGEIFFTRFDAIDHENKALRLVYLYCLLQGFHGKYHTQNSFELVQRIENERQILPGEWQQWPNNAAITPCHFPVQRPGSTVISRLFNMKYSWILTITAIYSLLNAVLLILF